jgi:transposase InsO family protein
MRLADNLRKAEEKSARTIRRGVERAREEWADVERRLRQRMRIYPQKPQALAAAASHGQLSLDHEMPDGISHSSEPRTPIVSIYGRDLNEP